MGEFKLLCTIDIQTKIYELIVQCILLTGDELSRACCINDLNRDRIGIDANGKGEEGVKRVKTPSKLQQ